MWKGVINNAPFIFNLRANARSNCLATKELFDANWSTHNTFDWLSLSTATWSPDFTPHTSSITIHSKKSPAISKSDFVNVPVRLEIEFISLFTHSGHCMRNTVGVHGKKINDSVAYAVARRIFDSYVVEPDTDQLLALSWPWSRFA